MELVGRWSEVGGWEKWVEILDTTRYAVRSVCQHSMVSIGFYELCLSSRVTKAWSQKLINLFVSETTESTCLIIIQIIMSI